jgi:uncharacterized membrane protein YkoI
MAMKPPQGQRRPLQQAHARLLRVTACAIFVLLTGLDVQAEEQEWEQVRELQSAGKILSLENFMGKAVEIHPGRVIDAKLKWEDSHGHYVYEIDVLDPRGEIWEVEFDAQTGRLVERERRGH